MISREALEYLMKDYQYYRKKLGYSEDLPQREEDEFNLIKQDLEVLNIITKLCKVEDGYTNPNFTKERFYIDCCYKYASEEEKALIINWCERNNIKIE